MRKWILFVVLLLALPALACSFSVDTGGETPEPTTAPQPIETPTEEAVEPSPTPLPTEAPPTPVPPAPTVPPASGPSFYDVGFASGVTDDGEPVDIAANFPAGTTMVFAFASYDGMTNGLECESVWYRDGQEVVRDPLAWVLGEAAGPLWIANLSNDDGLLPAEYDWELYVDGDLAVTASFVVDRETASPILYQDDFSDPGSGWEVGDYDDGSVGYRDGAYFVTSTTNEKVMWGLATRSFSDLILEVDATQVSAPANDDNAYGVMCRVQANGYDGYILRISGDGFSSIHKVVDGSPEVLVAWSESEAIRQGNAMNRLRVVCDGSTLALFVNGELAAEASDTSFTEGDIALIVATYEDEATEVHFDNLVVTRPAP